MRKLARPLGVLTFMVLGFTAGTFYMDTNTVSTTGAGEGYAKVSVTSTTIAGGGVVYHDVTPNFPAP